MSEGATADPRAAARAIDALRRGWPIAIRGDGPTMTLLAIETADEPRLAAFASRDGASVLLSAGRAATLRFDPAGEVAAPESPVLIARASSYDLAAATALADPQRDGATAQVGDQLIPLQNPAAAAAALRIARIAGLLPAFFVGEGAAEVTIAPADIDAYEDPAPLSIAGRARLPLSGADEAEIVAFRSPSRDDPIALLIGRADGQPPLVRLHSECLTGDVLGSLKCDCGPQLHAAIAAIAAAGWGILLYLRQEGRGIGLVNKLRAYALQDRGFDTVDANLRLGFAADARDYGVAARMLMLLGQDRVRLMTNNPAKVAALTAAGIDVERVAHRAGENAHNAAYLAVKLDRIGHQP